MNIGYLRVSTADQNLDRQREALKGYNIERWFEEKLSGKDTNRPKLQEMLSFASIGDTIYVHDFSRLARSTKDLLDIVESLSKQNISIISIKEKLDSSTPTGKLMLTMIGAIDEFERTIMLERQREGIEVAKQKGVYKGRKAIAIPKNFGRYFDAWKKHEANKTGIAHALGVSRPTVDRFINEYSKTTKKD